MVRVKRGTTAHKRRKHLLKYAKGFRWGRKSKYAAAKTPCIMPGNMLTREERIKKETSGISGKPK